MCKIVYWDPDTRCWAHQSGQSLDPETDEVWPEVSSKYALDNPAPVDPKNAPRRVFFEVGLVLAIVGVLAIAAAVWMPSLS